MSTAWPNGKAKSHRLGAPRISAARLAEQRRRVRLSQEAFRCGRSDRTRRDDGEHAAERLWRSRTDLGCRRGVNAVVAPDPISGESADATICHPFNDRRPPPEGSRRCSKPMAFSRGTGRRPRRAQSRSASKKPSRPTHRATLGGPCDEPPPEEIERSRRGRGRRYGRSGAKKVNV